MKVDFKYIASFLVVVLLFLGVVVLSGDYIDYRRNYKDFQEYMAQKEQQDNGNSETPETGTIPPETTPQETTPAETEPAVTPAPMVPGEVLAGSHAITDVSGNVLWQADSLTQEEVDAIRGYVAERKEVTALVETKILPMPNIKNVFLDDDLLSEVRICQAM